MARTGVALILVDIQNDFLPPNGALAVGHSEEVLPAVHRLLEDPSRYDLIVATLVRRLNELGAL